MQKWNYNWLFCNNHGRDVYCKMQVLWNCCETQPKEVVKKSRQSGGHDFRWFLGIGMKKWNIRCPKLNYETTFQYKLSPITLEKSPWERMLAFLIFSFFAEIKSKWGEGGLRVIFALCQKVSNWNGLASLVGMWSKGGQYHFNFQTTVNPLFTIGRICHV